MRCAMLDRENLCSYWVIAEGPPILNEFAEAVS
jgi:hypothetical protein